MDIKVHKQRQSVRDPGSDWVSARVIDSEYRTTIYPDSIISLNGLPSSIEGGIEGEGKEWGRMKFLKFMYSHPFSVLYWVIMVIIGSVWQGWI